MSTQHHNREESGVFNVRSAGAYLSVGGASKVPGHLCEGSRQAQGCTGAGLALEDACHLKYCVSLNLVLVLANSMEKGEVITVNGAGTIAHPFGKDKNNNNNKEPHIIYKTKNRSQT